jgi:predicted anti-sigma-YlaC factor YlaD
VSGCEHVRHDLGGYVLGALEPAEATAVREHLTSCGQCAAEHARLAGLPELLALADGLHAGDAASPPAALEERLLDIVARDRAAPARRRRARRPWLAGAAALAAVALAALVVALTGGEDAQTGYDLRLRPVGASAASARVRLEAVAGGTTVHLWVRDLPGDPGAVYEVRCDAPGWTASAGTFRVDTRGRAYVVLTTAARRGEYEAIRIVRREHGRSVPVLAADLS